MQPTQTCPPTGCTVIHHPKRAPLFLHRPMLGGQKCASFVWELKGSVRTWWSHGLRPVSPPYLARKEETDLEQARGRGEQYLEHCGNKISAPELLGPCGVMGNGRYRLLISQWEEN